MSNAKKRIYIECKQIGDIERYALEYSCVTVRPKLSIEVVIWLDWIRFYNYGKLFE